MEKHFIGLAFCIKLCVFCLILGQGINIQLIPYEKLDSFKNIQFFKTVRIQARRGRILDRHGKEMAINVPTYSLFADPLFVENPRWVAHKIASWVDVSTKTLEHKMRKSSRFVWLKRNLDIHKKNKIKALKIRGLYFMSESKRQYPEKETLATTLGFVGQEGQGLEGLEYKYNHYLKGQDVQLKVSQDAKGRPLVMDPEQYIHPPEGHDIQLTVDAEFQKFLELQLKKVYEVQKAKRAFGLILEASTGAVRAVGQWPSYDANQALNVPSSGYRNPLFQEVYEQGSTIKPFTIAAGLEHEIFKPRSQFDCKGGKIKIGHRVITDSIGISCHQITLSEGLKKSSNVVLIQAGFMVGEKKLKSFYKKLGFDQATHIGFPGESSGLFKSSVWSQHLLASASFGHGLALTPIQVAVAYGAIANGGLKIQPYLVEKIIDPSGLEKKAKGHQVRVFSEKTSKILRAMLIHVTTPGGTGEKATVEGFLVGGKTGTANKVNFDKNQYYKDRFLSSFVGIVPADRPQYVIYIGVDEPQKNYYASEVAAPIFSKVAQFILTKENKIPQNLQRNHVVTCQSLQCGYEPQNRLSGNLSLDIKNLKASTLKGLTLREVLRILRGTQIQFKVQGEGRVVEADFVRNSSQGPDDPVQLKLKFM